MQERTCERCGRTNDRPLAAICTRCKKALDNAKARGTTAPPPLDAFDCEWCGKHCVRGVDVVPHASRFCSVPHKKAWHQRQQEGGQLLRSFTDEPRPSDVAAYQRAMRADPCAYCGAAAPPSRTKRNDYRLDHVTSKSRGGPNDWTNYTACCKRCNGAKGDLPMLCALLWMPTSRQYHDLRRVLWAA